MSNFTVNPAFTLGEPLSTERAEGESLSAVADRLWAQMSAEERESYVDVAQFKELNFGIKGAA